MWNQTNEFKKFKLNIQFYTDLLHMQFFHDDDQYYIVYMYYLLCGKNDNYHVYFIIYLLLTILQIDSAKSYHKYTDIYINRQCILNILNDFFQEKNEIVRQKMTIITNRIFNHNDYDLKFKNSITNSCIERIKNKNDGNIEFYHIDKSNIVQEINDKYMNAMYVIHNILLIDTINLKMFTMFTKIFYDFIYMYEYVQIPRSNNVFINYGYSYGYNLFIKFKIIFYELYICDKNINDMFDYLDHVMIHNIDTENINSYSYNNVYNEQYV